MSNPGYKHRKPAAKRLTICCDGTCMSSVTGNRNIPSNITRLARTIAKAGVDDNGNEWQQVVYYDSGVGTGSLQLIEKARQGGTGDGLVDNVLEAYNFLVNNYCPGDQIFCFGFSRGAFTARCIAGLVADIGIFKPDNMQAFAPLWAAYQTNIAKHEFRKTKEYFQYVKGVRPMVPQDKANEPYIKKPNEIAHGLNLIWPNSHEIEVLGCFDTVGSLGLGDTRLFTNAWSRHKFEYLNVKLSPYIKHAFHAIGLDEHRETFAPTLFYIPNDATLAADEAEIEHEDDDWPELKAFRDEVQKDIDNQKEKCKPDLYQVWFPGVHINIGGGADENSYDGEGLANLTLAWMVQMLGPYLAFEPWTWGEAGMGGYPRRVVEEQWRYSTKEDSTTSKTASTGSWFAHAALEKLGYAKETKLVPIHTAMIKEPDRSSSIRADGKQFRWAISEYQDSYTRMYWAISAPMDRIPGECVDRSTEKRTPLKQLGETNEYIHPSVEWRRRNLESEKNTAKKYHPNSLKGYTRTTDHDGGTGYFNEGTTAWIPEWYVKPAAPGRAESEVWRTAEWELTRHVEDRDALHEFLNEIHEANLKREKEKEAERL